MSSKLTSNWGDQLLRAAAWYLWDITRVPFLSVYTDKHRKLTPDAVLKAGVYFALSTFAASSFPISSSLFTFPRIRSPRSIAEGESWEDYLPCRNPRLVRRPLTKSVKTVKPPIWAHLEEKQNITKDARFIGSNLPYFFFFCLSLTRNTATLNCPWFLSIETLFLAPFLSLIFTSMRASFLEYGKQEDTGGEIGGIKGI